MMITILWNTVHMKQLKQWDGLSNVHNYNFKIQNNVHFTL